MTDCSVSNIRLSWCENSAVIFFSVMIHCFTFLPLRLNASCFYLFIVLFCYLWDRAKDFSPKTASWWGCWGLITVLPFLNWTPPSSHLFSHYFFWSFFIVITHPVYFSHLKKNPKNSSLLCCLEAVQLFSLFVFVQLFASLASKKKSSERVRQLCVCWLKAAD